GFADGQAHRRRQIATDAGGDHAVVGQANRVALAQVQDAYLPCAQLLDTYMIFGDKGVLDDDARDARFSFGSGAATEFDRTGKVLKVLALPLISHVETKHGQRVLAGGGWREKGLSGSLLRATLFVVGHEGLSSTVKAPLRPLLVGSSASNTLYYCV